jgi:Tannase and feruloyl esterase
LRHAICCPGPRGLQALLGIGALTLPLVLGAAGQSAAPATQPATSRFSEPRVSLAVGDCTAAKIGGSLPATAIGEPVAGVTLAEPRWVAATDALPARCEVEGRIAPIDTAANARPINFRVWLPAEWNRRAVQQGGGGMNGVIPDLRGGGYPIDGRSPAQWGFVTYGSDSGHQASPGRRGGPPPDAVAAAGATDEWALNDEAVRNLGYLQLKKTRDAAMAIVQRAYGERPRFTYFTGTSQGGREALTVAQRYPADYDGVIANVPIVSFSSLMLAPELIRIHEKPLARWVTRAKTAAIRAEFLRQCDALDGLTDGVVNNYVACRAIFDVTQGARNRRPWAAKRCPDNVDPNPADTSAGACLTDGQISTLEFVYSRYRFSTPLAHDLKSFGMWVPNTDPSGSGLIAEQRFKGQEGAVPDAPMHGHLGVLGVTGFLMRDLRANPLDYVEGGPLNRRRGELSAVLDSTDPDLRPFTRRGGKMIVTIGTDDTLASPGAQLDYFQAVLDRMGRRAVDDFARLFVVPQANHGLMARTADVDGAGKPLERSALPTQFERFALLVDWVERRVAPGQSITLTGGNRTLPLCSYPTYPKYVGGDVASSTSYRCADR